MRSFRLWVYRLLVRYLPETRCFGLKVALLRWAGAQIGRNVRICSSANFLGNGKLAIGDDVWIGPGCFICPVGSSEIKIGSHCDLAPQVMLLTGSHEIDTAGAHIAGRGISADVSVGDGCWLGARSQILPGVILGRKTVVAAGSVVISTDIDGFGLVAGVPATLKKRFPMKAS